MDLSQSEELFHSLGKYAQGEFGFKNPPVLNLVSDGANQMKPLGKTAYYDPEGMSISIYVDGRHPKDILRSFAHELVHHTQNENGKLNDGGYSGEGYAQKNKNLRAMERDAYERGNMCFRDWEDQLKQEKPTIYNERRINNMSTKKWKNKELSQNLSEKFGFKMNLGALNESKEKEYDLEENQDRIFAPNHYCLHHVIYEGKEGHTIDHNWNEKLQKVTKYDVKFKDGTIIRNIHESKLTALESFTEEDHKRDDHPPVKKEKEVLDEEEQEEKEDLKKEEKDKKSTGDIGEKSVKMGADDNEKETKMDHLPDEVLKNIAKKKEKKNESRLMKTIKRMIREELKNNGKK